KDEGYLSRARHFKTLPDGELAALLRTVDGEADRLLKGKVLVEERLQWCLRYGCAKSLGRVEDWAYHPRTLELIDRAMAREKQRAAVRAASPLPSGPPATE